MRIKAKSPADTNSQSLQLDYLRSIEKTVEETPATKLVGSLFPNFCNQDFLFGKVSIMGSVPTAVETKKFQEIPGNNAVTLNIKKKK